VSDNEFILKLVIRLRMGLLLHKAATTTSLTEEIEPLIRRVYGSMPLPELKHWLDIMQQDARESGLCFGLSSRSVLAIHGWLLGTPRPGAWRGCHALQ